MKKAITLINVHQNNQSIESKYQGSHFFPETIKRMTVLLLLLAAYIFIPNYLYAQFMQQGNKLVGTGTNGKADQGYAVSVSSDGNTAIVGGTEDNGGIG